MSEEIPNQPLAESDRPKLTLWQKIAVRIFLDHLSRESGLYELAAWASDGATAIATEISTQQFSHSQPETGLEEIDSVIQNRLRSMGMNARERGILLNDRYKVPTVWGMTDEQKLDLVEYLDTL